MSADAGNAWSFPAARREASVRCTSYGDKTTWDFAPATPQPTTTEKAELSVADPKRYGWAVIKVSRL